MSVEFLQEILDKFIKNLDISKEATKLKDSLAESQDSNKDLAELLEKTKNLVETFYSNSKDLKEEFFKQYNIHSSRLGLEELNDGHDSVEKEKEDSKEPQEASEEPEAPNELEAPLKEPQSTKEPDTPEESETTKELESSKKVKAPKERKTSKKSKALKESEVPDKLETPKKCVTPSKPDVDKESEQSPQDENCNLGTPKKPAGRKDSSEVEISMNPLLENSHIENNVGNHDKNETPEVNGDAAEAPATVNDDIKSPDGKKPFKFGIKLVDINKLVEPKTAMRSPDASKYQVKKTVQFDSSVILISTSSDDTDDDEKNTSNKRRKSLEKEKHPKKIALVDVSSEDSSEDSQDEDFVVSKKTSKRDSLDKKSSPKKTLPSRRSKENAIKINKKLQKLDKISSKKHKKKDTSSDEDSSSLSDLSDSEEEVAKDTESRSSLKKNGLSKPRSKKEFQTVVVDGYDWHSDVKFKSKCVINVLRVPCEEMKEYYGNKQDDLEVSRLTDKKTLKRRRQKSSELNKSDGEKDSSASSSPANSTDAVDKSKAKKTKLSDKTSAAAEDGELCPVTGSFKSKADSTRSDLVDKTDTADEKNAKKTKSKDGKKDGKKADKKDEDGKKSVESSSSDKDEDDLGSDGLPDFCSTSSPVPSPVQRPAPLEESQNGSADNATTEMADVAMEALNSDKEDVSNSDSDKEEEDVTEKETTKRKNSKKKSKKEEIDGKSSAEKDDKSEDNEEESKKDETTPENEKLQTPSSRKDADKDKEDKDKCDKDKDEEKKKSDKESDVEEEGETPKKNKKKAGEAKKTKKSKFELSDTEEDEDKDGENKDKDKEDGKSDGEDEDNKKGKGDEEDQSEEDDKKDKSKRKTVPGWKKDKLLTTKISSSDSEEESRKFKKKKKALKEASDKSDSEEEVSKRKTRQRNKGKKKTIVIDSDSDNDKKSNASSDDMFKSDDAEEDSSKSSNEESEKENENKKPSSRKRIKRVKDSSSDDNEEKSTRKQIRGIWGRDSLAETTKKAEAEERERKARIAEKQKKYNQIYDVGTDLNAKVDKIVLDFDEKTKKGLIKVHKKIVEKMKPHQAAGVQFMWDACFESLERAQKTPGSGCILAHCMGLGKTLQVIALTHTLLVNYEKTKVKKVMVVCPLNTVLNWVSEYKQWLPDDEAFEVFELVSYKQNYERQHQIKEWHNCGGVLIIGYDMYRNLSNPDSKKFSKKMRQTFQEALVDPGPDLVVCDEGHLLKNEKTNLSIAMNRLKTLRRIVLTGTPLQNNMKEYFCMVQFIKPNLLGTYKEYLNRFVNPITNGQYTDSTPHDIQIMRKRSHVLHKMLDGVVQRRDYSVLQPYLPPKHEYVLFLNLTEVQIKLYEHYMMNFARRAADGSNKTSFLFVDFQNFQRICTHPRVLLDKSIEDRNAKDLLDDEESESEGSIKDFIDDDDDDDTTSEDSNSSSSDNSDDSDNSGKDGKKKKKGKSKKKDDKKGGTSGSKSNSNNRGGPRKRLTRAAVASAKENNEDVEFMDLTDDSLRPKEWWQSHCDGEELDNIMHSSKLFLLFEILKECEQIGDKVLVFSQSLYSLNVIEYFLGKIHDATQEDKDMCGYTGSWCLGLDYFRLDGSSSCDNRSIWCKSFNNPKNTRARLFLISTRAGGLGINLVAANRVIIFDVSWNPSHDIQSIYRVYRFGQTKPSYVYRFVTYGTMEMKIYERQVTKQAISKRVIDEQQIDRHYNQNDLAELYKFEPRPEDRPIPLVPKDVLLGELLQKHEDRIFKYHEHQSLLENKAEECLNEEERKAAWEEFEHEKTVRAKTAQPNNFMAPPAITAALMSLVKRDNPAWTDNQVRAIIPALTVQLQEQVAAGDLTMYQRVTKEIRYLQQLQNQRMREQYLQQQALRMFQQQQAMVNGGMVFNPAMFQNLNMPGTSNQTMPRALNNPTVPNEVIDLND